VEDVCTKIEKKTNSGYIKVSNQYTKVVPFKENSSFRFVVL